MPPANLRPWFERARTRARLGPPALAYSLRTRSGKVDPENLRKRDPDFVAACEAAAAKRPGSF